jgi:hypothetical protein
MQDEYWRTQEVPRSEPAALLACADGFPAAADVEFLIDFLNMAVHRVGADGHCGGKRLVGLPARQALQHGLRRFG